MIFRPKSPPKTIQNRSKGLPKASFFHLRFRLRFWYDFGSILAPKRPPFGRPFGAKVAPQKRSKFDLPKRAPQYAPRAPPGAHKTPQEAPKRLSRGAKDAPKTLHEALKRLSRAPPGAQNGVKKEEPLNSIVVQNSIVMHSIDSELKRER